MPPLAGLVETAARGLDQDADGPGTDWATATMNNTNHVGHFGFRTRHAP